VAGLDGSLSFPPVVAFGFRRDGGDGAESALRPLDVAGRASHGFGLRFPAAAYGARRRLRPVSAATSL
jgi:hypothetical protein